MPQEKNLTNTSTPTLEAKRIQCHFISNTHWDREWRLAVPAAKAAHLEEVVTVVLPN